MGEDPGPRRYRFGPLHRPGLVAGFRAGQLAAVALALLVDVAVLRAAPDAAGVVVALAVLGVGVAAASWPLAGRTAEEWAPDAVRFAAGRARHLRWDGGLFRWLSVVTVEVTGGRPVGVVVDRRRGVVGAVVSAGAPGFLLASPAVRDRRVADWATVLASLARDGSALYRLQWIERAVPDDGTGHRADLEARAVLGGDDPAQRSYRQLLDRVAAGAVVHAVLLVVTVRHRRVRSPLAGGARPAVDLLLREVANLRRRLGEAGIECSPPLGPHQLAGQLRAATAPARVVAVEAAGSVGPGGSRAAGAGAAGAAGTGAAGADAAGAGPAGVGPAGDAGTAGWAGAAAADGADDVAGPSWPWPMACADEWARLRTDDTWHVTYWVAQWPRQDVPADFLAALLLEGSVRRTVSVVMAPVPPGEAARRVEQDRTAEAADTELRRRGGFLATARRQRQAEHLAGREAELADGHATFRLTAYVTVTADRAEDLPPACEQVEQAAAQAGLELRCCYGDQLRAFAAALPLGMGLP